MDQIRNGENCTSPCDWSSVNAEVFNFLESDRGMSYRKMLVETQLWADGRSRVEGEDGSVKYVGGEFLGSSQAHSRTKTALPFASSTPSGTLLGPTRANAYGPGINAGATGRPFVWKPDSGGPALGPIQPNVFGPGVGMDATGRPVRPACPPGWMGPC